VGGATWGNWRTRTRDEDDPRAVAGSQCPVSRDAAGLT